METLEKIARTFREKADELLYRAELETDMIEEFYKRGMAEGFNKAAENIEILLEMGGK